MKGAREYYNLVKEAYRNEFPNMIEIGMWNGGDSQAYKIGGIIFITASHARGKTFHIVLTNLKESYDTKEIKRGCLLKVYGVVGGRSGWTEFYGWKEDGVWIEVIEKLFAEMRDFIEQVKMEEERRNTEQIERQKKNKEDKITLFNSMSLL